MFVLFFFIMTLVIAFAAGFFIWSAMNPTKTADKSHESDYQPGQLKTTLLKVKEALSEDDSSLTYCKRCNRSMLRQYYNNRPTNDYKCSNCGNTVTLKAY